MSGHLFFLLVTIGDYTKVGALCSIYRFGQLFRCGIAKSFQKRKTFLSKLFVGSTKSSNFADKIKRITLKNMFNADNLKYFNQPNDADNWIWRIENAVGDWVKKNNKSFWYVVLWESKRSEILKKEITREEFATLLVQECMEALSEGDTVDKIVYSIEKFPYKRHLKAFDKQPDASKVRQYVKEVSDLLTRDVTMESSNDDYTLEQRVQEHLEKITANETYAKVCIHPIYNGKTATMSIEKYVSKRFWDEHRPSQTVIFECVNESLTEERVEMLYGRFGSLCNTKLFIASIHSFGGGVKREACGHGIGLVLVDPQREINEDCFVMPRQRGNQQSEEVLWNNMLMGSEKMTMPLLVYDNGQIDNSLSSILYKYASCGKRNLFVKAPILSDAEIEHVAYKLTRPQTDYYNRQLQQCGPNDKIPSCIIDPYQIAKDMGLTVKRGKIGNKLGHIDILHKKVTLSKRLNYEDPSDRYSMAHEIGHNVLHRRVSEKTEDGCHHIGSKTKEWLEHHANCFASCLLMPASVIRLLYNIYWKKEFKTDKVAPIVVKKDFYSDPIFQHVVAPVARKMNVSLQAAYIRLKKMGLLLEAM